MVQLLARIAKRLTVLLLGAVVAYVATDKVFAFFDNRTPLALALFGTYVVTAYGLIPLAFRAFRLLYQPVHLPLYCTTPDGFASDPVNIALVGERRQVILAMEAAGWQRADQKTPVTLLRQITYTLLKRSYSNAPMSNLYLFGHRQDLAFQKEISGTRGHRHHVRFWATDSNLADKFAAHKQFWRRFRLPSRNRTQARLWVGAASKDIGFALIRHNAQITHMIDPDTASERELIVSDLQRARQLADKRTVPAYRPFSLPNRALRGHLNSDGCVTICELR